MKRVRAVRVVAIVGWLGLAGSQSHACTSIVVTRGASSDGSVMVTYTCDGEFLPTLDYVPARDYADGDSLEIADWQGPVRGKIKQVGHTYAVIGMMNEHQLAIGETTFNGRKELENPDGLLGYWDLILRALERAKTAREAISVMTGLVAEYGYCSTGETFSIADRDEAWIMEMIGPGPGGEGAEWVALRVPDGYIAAYANQARIGEFPLDDPANCLYSANVVQFAVEKGYYDPASGRPFRFCDAYSPSNSETRRFADARIWSIFRRAALSRNFSPDYHRSEPGAEPYPLWIRPDTKLALADVFALMRDQYEGTPYDMTKGVDAGPFGCPKRWRPLTWTVDSVEYAWERSISTQQTAYSFVSQSRAWLPDCVGGVFWYGLDDTYTSCYMPFYCCVDSVPEALRAGTITRFSWDSAWWVFNLVANYACLKYSYMLPEIRAVQTELESEFLAMQPAVERAALDLGKSDPGLLRRYLVSYSTGRAEMVFSRWQGLAAHLIAKYNDGYVQDEQGEAQDAGYPEAWLREVLRSGTGRFKLEPAAAR